MKYSIIYGSITSYGLGLALAAGVGSFLGLASGTADSALAVIGLGYIVTQATSAAYKGYRSYKLIKTIEQVALKLSKKSTKTLREYLEEQDK